MDWFEETLHPGLHARLRIDKLLYQCSDSCQSRTLILGSILLFFPLIQSFHGAFQKL